MVKDVTVFTLLACALLVLANDAGAAPGFMGQHVVLQRVVVSPTDARTSRAGTGRTLSDDVAEPTIITRSRIWFSSDGFRAISRDGIRQSMSNFALRRVWLMDRIRQVALELHLPEQQLAPRDLPAGLTPAGLFANTPCAGLKSRQLVRTRWRGRELTPHECLDSDGAIMATHDFSETLALVIRTRSPDGRREEFRHIEQVELPAGHFELPVRYRIVDSQEFRHGAGPIP